MNGVEYLLDTNVLLGLIKENPEALQLLETTGFSTARCHYSPISRMEALGFPGIVDAEIHALSSLFFAIRSCPLDTEVENATIAMRRQRKIKLPDAIIAATARVNHLQLLTLDKDLFASYLSFQT